MMLLVIVWQPHIQILSLSTSLRSAVFSPLLDAVIVVLICSLPVDLGSTLLNDFGVKFLKMIRWPH